MKTPETSITKSVAKPKVKEANPANVSSFLRSFFSVASVATSYTKNQENRITPNITNTTASNGK